MEVITGDPLKDVVLNYWYSEPTRPNKDDFVAERWGADKLKIYAHNAGFSFELHELNKCVQTLDKAGKLALESLEDYHGDTKKRAKNAKEFGTTIGAEGIIDEARQRAEKIRSNILTAEYKRYIHGSVWKARSLRYLEECCKVGDGIYRCEMCGRECLRHEINVHHNDIYKLDGRETNQELLGCCAGLCHDLADIARRVQRGEVDRATLNDCFRPLFSEAVQQT